MRIKDLLRPEAIELGAAAADKEAAIDELIALHGKIGDLNDPAGFKEAILKRESESTTAIGEGIAVPHAKTNTVKEPGLAAMTVPDGVDYDAPDGMPSNLFFMIAVPEGAGDAHLEILSHLMMMLMDPDFSNALRNAESPESFLDIITKQEAEKFPEEPPQEEKPAAEETTVAAATEAARNRRRKPDTVFLPSQLVPTALPTRLWLLRPWNGPARRWASPSRWRPTAPAASRMR